MKITIYENISVFVVNNSSLQVRFELCAQALDASLKTIAPWRDPEFLEKFKGFIETLTILPNCIIK